MSSQRRTRACQTTRTSECIFVIVREGLRADETSDGRDVGRMQEDDDSEEEEDEELSEEEEYEYEELVRPSPSAMRTP